MKKSIFKIIGFPILIWCLILIIPAPFQGCRKPLDPACDSCGRIRALKPNIYLYPTEKTQLDVSLSFPRGGKIVTSVPNYNTGWKIVVDPSGLINDNYQFLFYESDQPDIWQTNKGWVVRKDGLSSFFTANMIKYGFRGNEIEDFIDYWIPRLTNSEYYEIYPQESKIVQTVITLEISKKPDNILRLFYVIKETSSESNKNIINPPEPAQFSRTGFYVTEWGVVLK
jgi:hypothetical protein